MLSVRKDPLRLIKALILKVTLNISLTSSWRTEWENFSYATPQSFFEDIYLNNDETCSWKFCVSNAVSSQGLRKRAWELQRFRIWFEWRWRYCGWNFILQRSLSFHFFKWNLSDDQFDFSLHLQFISSNCYRRTSEKLRSRAAVWCFRDWVAIFHADCIERKERLRQWEISAQNSNQQCFKEIWSSF